MIDFDEIWLKCSKDSRIEFACFSFHVGSFLSTFRPSNWTLKATRIMMLHQANAPTLMRFNFKKNTPKLIIFGTHNLHTSKHNALINQLLLMQFYLFNIRPKLHHRK